MRIFVHFLLGWLMLAALPAALRAFPQYHDNADRERAKGEARERHLPLAWVGGWTKDLSVPSPVQSSAAELLQLDIATLQDNAVIIFFDGSEYESLPEIIHAQFHIADDGPLPGGHFWNTPKVVFSNADVDKVLGRVSETQVARDREVAINSALQIIRNDPKALDSNPVPPVASAAPAPAEPATALASGLDVVAWLIDNGIYLALGFGVVLVAGVALAMRLRARPDAIPPPGDGEK